MEGIPRLLELARYCLDHAEREYTKGGAKAAEESAQRLLNVASQLIAAIRADIAMEDAGITVVRDISELERIQEVETTIDSMIVNLEKFKDHIIEKGEGCKWCVFNLLNDIHSLYTVLDVTVRRTPCTQGRHHILEARLSPALGVLVKARLDTLLSMQPQDTFVAINPDNVQEEVPVAFVPCECLIGYVVVPAGVVEEIPGSI